MAEVIILPFLGGITGNPSFRPLLLTNISSNPFPLRQHVAGPFHNRVVFNPGMQQVEDEDRSIRVAYGDEVPRLSVRNNISNIMSRTGSISWSLMSVSSLEPFGRSNLVSEVSRGKITKKYAKRGTEQIEFRNGKEFGHSH